MSKESNQGPVASAGEQRPETAAPSKAGLVPESGSVAAKPGSADSMMEREIREFAKRIIDAGSNHSIDDLYSLEASIEADADYESRENFRQIFATLRAARLFTSNEDTAESTEQYLKKRYELAKAELLNEVIAFLQERRRLQGIKTSELNDSGLRTEEEEKLFHYAGKQVAVKLQSEEKLVEHLDSLAIDAKDVPKKVKVIKDRNDKTKDTTKDIQVEAHQERIKKLEEYVHLSKLFMPSSKDDEYAKVCASFKKRVADILSQMIQLKDDFSKHGTSAAEDFVERVSKDLIEGKEYQRLLLLNQQGILGYLLSFFSPNSFHHWFNRSDLHSRRASFVQEARDVLDRLDEGEAKFAKRKAATVAFGVLANARPFATKRQKVYGVDSKGNEYVHHIAINKGHERFALFREMVNEHGKFTTARLPYRAKEQFAKKLRNRFKSADDKVDKITWYNKGYHWLFGTVTWSEHKEGKIEQKLCARYLAELSAQVNPVLEFGEFLKSHEVEARVFLEGFYEYGKDLPGVTDALKDMIGADGKLKPELQSDLPDAIDKLVNNLGKDVRDSEKGKLEQYYKKIRALRQAIANAKKKNSWVLFAKNIFGSLGWSNEKSSAADLLGELDHHLKTCEGYLLRKLGPFDRLLTGQIVFNYADGKVSINDGGLLSEFFVNYNNEIKKHNKANASRFSTIALQNITENAASYKDLFLGSGFNDVERHKFNLIFIKKEIAEAKAKSGDKYRQYVELLEACREELIYPEQAQHEEITEIELVIEEEERKFFDRLADEHNADESVTEQLKITKPEHNDELFKNAAEVWLQSPYAQHFVDQYRKFLKTKGNDVLATFDALCREHKVTSLGPDSSGFFLGYQAVFNAAKSFIDVEGDERKFWNFEFFVKYLGEQPDQNQYGEDLTDKGKLTGDKKQDYENYQSLRDYFLYSLSLPSRSYVEAQPDSETKTKVTDQLDNPPTLARRLERKHQFLLGKYTGSIAYTIVVRGAGTENEMTDKVLGQIETALYLVKNKAPGYQDPELEEALVLLKNIINLDVDAIFPAQQLNDKSGESSKYKLTDEQKRALERVVSPELLRFHKSQLDVCQYLLRTYGARFNLDYLRKRVTVSKDKFEKIKLFVQQNSDYNFAKEGAENRAISQASYYFKLEPEAGVDDGGAGQEDSNLVFERTESNLEDAARALNAASKDDVKLDIKETITEFMDGYVEANLTLAQDKQWINAEVYQQLILAYQELLSDEELEPKQKLKQFKKILDSYTPIQTDEQKQQADVLYFLNEGIDDYLKDKRKALFVYDGKFTGPGIPLLYFAPAVDAPELVKKYVHKRFGYLFGVQPQENAGEVDLLPARVLDSGVEADTPDGKFLISDKFTEDTLAVNALNKEVEKYIKQVRIADKDNNHIDWIAAENNNVVKDGYVWRADVQSVLDSYPCIKLEHKVAYQCKHMVALLNAHFRTDFVAGNQPRRKLSEIPKPLKDYVAELKQRKAVNGGELFPASQLQNVVEAIKRDHLAVRTEAERWSMTTEWFMRQLVELQPCSEFKNVLAELQVTKALFLLQADFNEAVRNNEYIRYTNWLLKSTPKYVDEDFRLISKHGRQAADILFYSQFLADKLPVAVPFKDTRGALHYREQPWEIIATTIFGSRKRVWSRSIENIFYSYAESPNIIRIIRLIELLQVADRNALQSYMAHIDKYASFSEQELAGLNTILLWYLREHGWSYHAADLAYRYGNAEVRNEYTLAKLEECSEDVMPFAMEDFLNYLAEPPEVMFQRKSKPIFEKYFNDSRKLQVSKLLTGCSSKNKCQNARLIALIDTVVAKTTWHPRDEMILKYFGEAADNSHVEGISREQKKRHQHAYHQLIVKRTGEILRRETGQGDCLPVNAFVNHPDDKNNKSEARQKFARNEILRYTDERKQSVGYRTLNKSARIELFGTDEKVLKDLADAIQKAIAIDKLGESDSFVQALFYLFSGEDFCTDLMLPDKSMQYVQKQKDRYEAMKISICVRDIISALQSGDIKGAKDRYNAEVTLAKSVRKEMRNSSPFELIFDKLHTYLPQIFREYERYLASNQRLILRASAERLLDTETLPGIERELQLLSEELTKCKGESSYDPKAFDALRTKPNQDGVDSAVDGDPFAGFLTLPLDPFTTRNEKANVRKLLVNQDNFSGHVAYLNEYFKEKAKVKAQKPKVSVTVGDFLQYPKLGSEPGRFAYLAEYLQRVQIGKEEQSKYLPVIAEYIESVLSVEDAEEREKLAFSAWLTGGSELHESAEAANGEQLSRLKEHASTIIANFVELDMLARARRVARAVQRDAEDSVVPEQKEKPHEYQARVAQKLSEIEENIKTTAEKFSGKVMGTTETVARAVATIAGMVGLDTKLDRNQLINELRDNKIDINDVKSVLFALLPSRMRGAYEVTINNLNISHAELLADLILIIDTCKDDAYKLLRSLHAKLYDAERGASSLLTHQAIVAEGTDVSDVERTVSAMPKVLQMAQHRVYVAAESILAHDEEQAIRKHMEDIDSKIVSDLHKTITGAYVGVKDEIKAITEKNSYVNQQFSNVMSQLDQVASKLYFVLPVYDSSTGERDKSEYAKFFDLLPLLDAERKQLLNNKIDQLLNDKKAVLGQQVVSALEALQVFINHPIQAPTRHTVFKGDVSKKSSIKETANYAFEDEAKYQKRVRQHHERLAATKAELARYHEFASKHLPLLGRFVELLNVSQDGDQRLLHRDGTPISWDALYSAFESYLPGDEVALSRLRGQLVNASEASVYVEHLVSALLLIIDAKLGQREVTQEEYEEAKAEFEQYGAYASIIWKLVKLSKHEPDSKQVNLPTGVEVYYTNVCPDECIITSEEACLMSRHISKHTNGLAELNRCDEHIRLLSDKLMGVIDGQQVYHLGFPVLIHEYREQLSKIPSTHATEQPQLSMQNAEAILLESMVLRLEYKAPGLASLIKDAGKKSIKDFTALIDELPLLQPSEQEYLVYLLKTLDAQSLRRIKGRLSFALSAIVGELSEGGIVTKVMSAKNNIRAVQGVECLEAVKDTVRQLAESFELVNVSGILGASEVLACLNEPATSDEGQLTKDKLQLLEQFRRHASLQQKNDFMTFVEYRKDLIGEERLALVKARLSSPSVLHITGSIDSYLKAVKDDGFTEFPELNSDVDRLLEDIAQERRAGTSVKQSYYGKREIDFSVASLVRHLMYFNADQGGCVNLNYYFNYKPQELTRILLLIERLGTTRQKQQLGHFINKAKVVDIVVNGTHQMALPYCLSKLNSDEISSICDFLLSERNRTILQKAKAEAKSQEFLTLDSRARRIDLFLQKFLQNDSVKAQYAMLYLYGYRDPKNPDKKPIFGALDVSAITKNEFGATYAAPLPINYPYETLQNQQWLPVLKRKGYKDEELDRRLHKMSLSVKEALLTVFLFDEDQGNLNKLKIKFAEAIRYYVEAKRERADAELRNCDGIKTVVSRYLAGDGKDTDGILSIFYPQEYLDIVYAAVHSKDESEKNAAQARILTDNIRDSILMAEPRDAALGQLSMITDSEHEILLSQQEGERECYTPEQHQTDSDVSSTGSSPAPSPRSTSDDERQASVLPDEQGSIVGTSPVAIAAAERQQADSVILSSHPDSQGSLLSASLAAGICKGGPAQDATQPVSVPTEGGEVNAAGSENAKSAPVAIAKPSNRR